MVARLQLQALVKMLAMLLLLNYGGPAFEGNVTMAQPQTVLSSGAASPLMGAEREQLEQLIREAVAVNPRIQRLEAEARSAWARVPQVRSLPDPMAEGTVFGEPQMMADGEMRGTFMISQTLPYLKQLNARGQEAAFEALTLQQEAHSARLRVIGDVEEAWYRLYLIRQLQRINEANTQLIGSLVEVATNRIEVGGATSGDVILGTLEQARTQEEQYMLQQQMTSRKAALNQLLSRPSDAAIDAPDQIGSAPVPQSLEELRTLAFSSQPEIVAARLRTQATAWGVRVARLERVPEVTMSYEHMFMSMNPGETGADPWRVGVGMNIPVWRSKYVAMEREARHRHFAAHRGVEEAVREYDAMLLDLLEQARTSDRTARLYRDTILPQSRQAFEADQRAYGQGAVTFERVVSDAQNLLTAESAYHRALTETAISIARLKQAAGGVLPGSVEERVPPPDTLRPPDQP